MSYYIKKIEISKIRNLTGLTIALDDKEKNHLILTGRNGSGKISLLETMRDYLVAFAEERIDDKALGEKTGIAIDIKSSSEYAEALKSGKFILAL